MYSLTSVNKGLVRHFDVTYFVRFMVLLLALYYLNKIYIDLVSKGEGMLYSPFLDRHLNYVNWAKYVLLHVSSFMANDFGVNTHIEGLNKLLIAGRPSLILGIPCIGFSMMILWTAFVNAHHYGWKKNLVWTIGGIMAICLINCFRIILMALAVEGRWNVNKFINHHDLFKLVGYALILGLMLLYSRQYTVEKVKGRRHMATA